MFGGAASQRAGAEAAPGAPGMSPRTPRVLAFQALGAVGGEPRRVTYDPYGKPRHHRGKDVTGNGDAAGDDLGVILGAAWGAEIDDAAYVANADLDRNGIINGGDFGALLGSWNSALSDGQLSAVDNIVGFDGYIHNQENDMYTVRHRTYEPVLGRWIERDPSGYSDGSNLYQMASGNTVGWSDPSGLCSGACNGGGANSQTIPGGIPAPPPLLVDPSQEVPTYRSFPTPGPANLSGCCTELWLKLLLRDGFSMRYDAYTTCCGGKVVICSWVTPGSIPFKPSQKLLVSPSPQGPGVIQDIQELFERMKELSGHDLGVALAEECLLAHEREHAERPPFSSGGCSLKPDAWTEEDVPVPQARQKEADCDHCGIYARQAQCMKDQLIKCKGANGPAAFQACRNALVRASGASSERGKEHCTRGGHGFGPLK